jgi:hypothetical protein
MKPNAKVFLRVVGMSFGVAFVASALGLPGPVASGLALAAGILTYLFS